MRRTTAILAVTGAFGAMIFAPSAALAAFQVCNKTALPVRAAIGRFDGTAWSSQGWWTVQPSRCTAILTGPLQGRFYYLYASDGAAGTWEGKTRFCVAPNRRFKAAERGNCVRYGLERRGFFEVDTGKKPDWTQSLSN